MAFWIPAFAGMTNWAGMTDWAGMMKRPGMMKGAALNNGTDGRDIGQRQRCGKNQAEN